MSNLNYNASSIKVLKGLEGVQKRPEMYIGNTADGSGYHHMVYEVVDNAVDESLAGHCDSISVVIHQDGSASVADNGRGIPTDIHETEGVSAAEVIMTQLHAGGKFDGNSYKVSGGLHGVGVSVVNALSDWLELTIWRSNKEYSMRFENGVKVRELSIVKDGVDKKGTGVRFFPSAKYFPDQIFSFDILEKRMRELAFLNSGLNIELRDERTAESIEMCYDGGVSAFVKELDKDKIVRHSTIIIQGESANIAVDLAMQWNDSYAENTLCFTNNVRQRDGGTHLAGYRGALTRCINNYANQIGAFKKDKVNLTPEDMREGLTSVLSVKVPDPKFASQTKDKLVNHEVRGVVEQVVSEQLSRWFEQNPQEAKIIVGKIIEAAAAREAARKARDLSRKKGGLEIASSQGKVANCQSKDPTECEIFFVEGESASGPAKQGRDRRVQAILPLRGKILNVQRKEKEVAGFDRILSSPEIGTMILALGTGIGKDAFNIEKLRYHKVIIMTDADVDGAHIRTLLLTFFFRHMPELIKNGHLYIAQPPLYKIKKGTVELYVKNDFELQNYLTTSAAANMVAIVMDQQRAGPDLIALVEIINNFCTMIKHLSNSFSNEKILQIASLCGFFEDDIDDEFVSKIKCYLSGIEKGIHNVKWDVEVDYMGGITLSRLERGVLDKYLLDKEDFVISEKDKLISVSQQLYELFQKPVTIVKKDKLVECFTPFDFMQYFIDTAKSGLYIQRFKGLGEMNADQLWDTTLNPETRTLLQVSIDDEAEAEEVFSILMGDIVEPRRSFILENALMVENLDA